MQGSGLAWTGKIGRLFPLWYNFITCVSETIPHPYKSGHIPAGCVLIEHCGRFCLCFGYQSASPPLNMWNNSVSGSSSSWWCTSPSFKQRKRTIRCNDNNEKLRRQPKLPQGEKFAFCFPAPLAAYYNNFYSILPRKRFLKSVSTLRPPGREICILVQSSIDLTSSFSQAMLCLYYSVFSNI